MSKFKCHHRLRVRLDKKLKKVFLSDPPREWGRRRKNDYHSPPGAARISGPRGVKWFPGTVHHLNKQCQVEDRDILIGSDDGRL